MLHSISFATSKDVKLISGILKERQEIALNKTIASNMQKCVETGRLASLETPWHPGMPNRPHIFWDSDLAKVMEGMAASLALRPDPALEKEYDRWVDLFANMQLEDGYLNTSFITLAPDQRFMNLMGGHELYCCGHLIEAAVVGYRLLGKDKFLKVMCRYADFLCTLFGPHGTRRGWPGHEEIELALVELYRVTGEKRYLELAAYFINDRGTSPNFFLEENPDIKPQKLQYSQAHRPVREQTEADGHAVRAVYLYSGMASLAEATDDQELLDACQRIFQNIAERRMYITGGIGSSFQEENFTIDYDLQNGSLMYAESCAAMGLTFFSRRMLNNTGEEKYAAVMERALFNGVLSGISLSGDKYFYTNYLEVDDNLKCYNCGSPVRKEWFDCSCCPTSYARYLTQLAQFVAAFDDAQHAIWIHLPVAAHIHHTFAPNCTAEMHIDGGYPYDGKISVTIEKDGEYTLHLRLPSWCDNLSVSLNKKTIETGKGGKYLVLNRKWCAGDTLTLQLDMPVKFMRSNSKVTNNLGCVALQRGPVIYCLESTDTPCPVRDIRLQLATAKPTTEILTEQSGLPAGTVAIHIQAWREEQDNPQNALYFEGAPTLTPIECKAIPYALWQNRGPAQMRVWILAI